jgi:hypothetical protein
VIATTVKMTCDASEAARLTALIGGAAIRVAGDVAPGLYIVRSVKEGEFWRYDVELEPVFASTSDWVPM